jgi:hypothetical protein
METESCKLIRGNVRAEHCRLRALSNELCEEILQVLLRAIAAFHVLAIAGLTSPDAQLLPAAYLSMNFVGWMIIFPLSLASLISGIIQGLGTVWGLFRHYWVLIKLVITALATALLLAHLHTCPPPNIRVLATGVLGRSR